MKELKLTVLNELDKLHNDELVRLKGGESGSGTIFGWCSCSCGCGTHAVKRSNRRSTRKFNKHCAS